MSPTEWIAVAILVLTVVFFVVIHYSPNATGERPELRPIEKATPPPPTAPPRCSIEDTAVLRGIVWLVRPLICNGTIVEQPFNPEQITEADLRNICLRMHTILTTIEMPRCEGRLMPGKIFDDIDTLESLVHGHASPFGHASPPVLAEWLGAIQEFGEYYGLNNKIGPIEVAHEHYLDWIASFDRAQEAMIARRKNTLQA